MFVMKINKSKICEIDSVSVSARTELAHPVRIGSFTYNFAVLQNDIVYEK